jgi:hypothetical protein
MAAVTCVVGAVTLYVWGLSRVRPFWAEFKDICASRYGESFDAAYGQVTLWPIGRRCNEYFDVVPGFVTPVIVGLTFVAGFSVTFALRAHLRRRRAPQPGIGAVPPARPERI